MENKMKKQKKKIESRTIFEFDISENKVIRISLWENEGKQIVDIRNWFKRKDGEFVPTRKGISVEANKLNLLIPCLQDTLKEL